MARHQHTTGPRHRCFYLGRHRRQGRSWRPPKRKQVSQTAKADSDIPLIFNPIPIDNIRSISFSDSSWANRSDGSSQGGQLHMMADKDSVEGKQSWITIIDWKSWKLRRVTRSSLAGEVQAFSDCQDIQEWLRTFWQELWGPTGIQLKQSDNYFYSDHASTILTDCKSLYDALAKIETSGLQLTERRPAIEATGSKVRLGQTNCNVRWVNSDRQFADGLTKPDACDDLRRFQRQGFWKIIFDPEFISAKK